MLFLGQNKAKIRAMEKRAKSMKSATPPLSWLESEGDKKGEAEVKKKVK